MNRFRLFALLGFLLALTAFIFNSKTETITNTTAPYFTPPSNNNITNNFLFGSLQSVRDYSFANVNDLGLNMWHSYTGGKFSYELNRFVPTGWLPSDSLTSIIAHYGSDVKSKLDSVYGNSGMRSLMQRPKIEFLCFGQRSDYQCEDASHVSSDLFFYTFQSPGHVGTDGTDNVNGATQYVRYCRTQASTNSGSSWSNAGMVVSRLKCNTEQSRPTESSNQWQTDGDCRWLIKPRVKIDSSFAHNNRNTKVCKVMILRRPGDTLKAVDIKAGNFLEDIGGQFFYNGRYLEEFYDMPLTDSLAIQNNWGNQYAWRSRGDWPVDSLSDTVYRSKVDIQVYWYANCDMWIDRVRVDNDVANKLFSPIDNFDAWIEDEATNIGNHTASPLKFYIELIEFNNIPCISYVNRKLQSLGANVDMVTDLTYHYAQHVNWDNRGAVFNADHIIHNYIDSINAKQIFMESYPLTSAYYPHPNSGQSYSRIPNTVNTNGDTILGYPLSPSDYDDWLQTNLNHLYTFEPGGDGPILIKDNSSGCTSTPNTPYQDIGNFRFTMQIAREISRQKNIPFIHMQQAHQWFTQHEVRREPTTEEMTLLSNLAISYGAKGIVYYWYTGHSNNADCDYSFGLADTNNQKRMINVYGEHKWDSLKTTISRIKKWDNYLMKFSNSDLHSYIYNNATERGDLIGSSYFSDIIPYKPGSTQQSCPDYDAPSEANPSGLIYECNEYRYLQAATFVTNPDDGNKYFMIVNRRCSPYKTGSENGARDIKVRFKNNSSLPTYNNWKLIDLKDNTSITFNKVSNSLLDLGWYNPGEGRLYKLTPVLRSGGTLAGDEVITGQTFSCEDTVWNDGHNITFKGNGNTISFSDSATIIMDGGTFKTDSASHGPQTTKNSFQPDISGHKWGGLKFNDCDIKIYNSAFSGISSPVGGNYAISSVDCPLNDLRYNTFTSSTDTAGGVSVNYVTTCSTIDGYHCYLMNNTFTMSSSFSRAAEVQGFAGLTAGVYVENNTMTSSGNATGIFLSTVTGGVLKNNSISGFSTGINTMLTTADLYGNTISNTSSVSNGIFEANLSSLNLAPSDYACLGGFNTVTNTSSGSHNLETDNSVFEMEGGNNTFNDGSGCYHLFGTFWDGAYDIKATSNCFSTSSTVIEAPAEPDNDITDGYSGINLVYMQYSCGETPPSGHDIVDIGNGLYDTIPNSSIGGGGESNRKGASQYAITEPVQASPKTIYDSIRVQMRHRNYSSVKSLCLELIDTYPDSAESVTVLQTLYMASCITDTTSSGHTALKTYYENLILNHGSNAALVEISNYLVQKCKVLLGQYSSAMSGFQSIIDNNPYGYEGLLARWDYMATSLLLNGGGGGENRNSDFGLPILDLMNNESEDSGDPDGDKSPFTKEQKHIIKIAISNTLHTKKDKEDEKIRIITKRANDGDEDARHELKEKMTFKNVIRSERPKNITEHLQLVNGDIQKIFGSKINYSPTGVQNSLPGVFSLSQNYPNPFNPITTIKYALPKDVKVFVRIYDILGREVRTIVNEFKKAGYYDEKFDGTNLASGVYFYRIEAGSYVESKKMVLIK